MNTSTHCTDPVTIDDPPRPAAVVVEELLADVAAACDAVRGVDSHQEPGWWPEGAWGGYRQHTVRGVLVHLPNDNAAHTGQLDFAREQIDGSVWDFKRQPRPPARPQPPTAGLRSMTMPCSGTSSTVSTA